MSDPQIPADKKFAFGELNDVSPSYSQRRLNSQSEDPLAAMRDAAIDHYTPNALEGVGPYKESSYKFWTTQTKVTFLRATGCLIFSAARKKAVQRHHPTS